MSPKELSILWSRRLFLSHTLALAIFLPGCLRPIYGKLGNNIDQKLRSIKISEIDSRLGHFLVNELTRLFYGGNEALEPKYNLAVTLDESSLAPLTDTIAGRVTSSTGFINAKFDLFQFGQIKPVFTGFTNYDVSYDRTSQRYSNVVAAANIEERGAKIVASLILTQLEGYFSQGK